MSDAPKRIWLHKDAYSHATMERHGEEICEYIRWDLVRDLIEAIKTNESFSSGHAENLAYLSVKALEDWDE